MIQTLCERPGADLLSEGIGPLGASSTAEEDGSLLQELRSESYLDLSPEPSEWASHREWEIL